MGQAPQRDDLARYAAFVHEHLGLRLGEEESVMVADALQARLRALGIRTPAEFRRRLDDALTVPEEVAAAAAALTIGETYFFRYPEQYRALVDVVLPACWRARPLLRVLSAGCSTGEEAYTVAMSVRDHPMAQQGYEARIIGVDVNAGVLQRAAVGSYTAWSFRQDASLMTSRHVIQEGRQYRVKDEVRKMVQFECHNLSDPTDDLWAGGAFDVIFCRNVLIYFDTDGINAVLTRLRSLLRPGGFLFLGHAENLRGDAPDLMLQHSHEAFYYRRRTDEQPAQGVAPLPEAWVNGIDASSRRLASWQIPTPAAVPSLPLASPTQVQRAQDSLAAATALFAQERFGDALAALGESQGELASLEARLLRAAILTNSGRFADANAACADVLRLDSLHAGAYCLQSLCLEHTGHHLGAVEAAQRSANLDPLFAMPRLHLGRLLKKSGQVQQAWHALDSARQLLRTEDESRIRIFGGGFGREALLELCRREMQGCQGGAG